MTGRILPRSAAATASHRSRRPRKTLALYLKALETQRSRSPAGLAAGTVGLSLPTLRTVSPAVALRINCQVASIEPIGAERVSTETRAAKAGRLTDVQAARF